MKLKKINEEHYVVVDETIQPVNGYYYDFLINKIKSTNGAEYGEASHCWQITHSTQPIEIIHTSGVTMTNPPMGFINIMDLSLEEVKELLGEVDVERKYTEEDMRKAWNAAYINAMSIDEETYKPLFFKDFIQSLQPKTEWKVEFINGKLTLI